MNDRINDAVEIPNPESLITQGKFRLPTIQFSKPGYGPKQLKMVNALCRYFKEKLEVRFYGHYGQGFDANMLKYIPDVQWLSIDCLEDIRNVNSLYELEAIRRFSFGVHNFEDSEFLANLPLTGLEELSLGDTKKNNLNLEPIAKANRLKTAGVFGHTKGIEHLEHCSQLSTLRLGRISKHQSLSFLSKIPKLSFLQLILGGRRDINDFRHPKIDTLEIVRVLGFEDLGDLSRFPRLKKLVIEDQIRLERISLDGVNLEDIRILNCKNLNGIEAISLQRNISHIRIYGTKLDLGELAKRQWPDSLETLALYSGKRKQDENLRKVLDEKGYKEFS